MGDGGLQQLIIVGLFLLFGLLDLVGRALKRRGGGQRAETDPNDYAGDYANDQSDFDAFGQPRERGPERMQPRAPEPDYEVWREEPVVERPAPVERQPSPVKRQPAPMSAPRTVQSGPRSAPTRSAPERGSAPRVAAPRVAALRVAPVRVQSARKASAGMTALDRMDTSSTARARSGAPLLNVHDARRAILAMTILGPCRAFEAHQDPSGSR